MLDDRLTPAQIGVLLICGQSLPPLSEGESLETRIRHGRTTLVKISGIDLGYDLKAWHDHLKRSRQGGYTFGRNLELPGSWVSR
jgi:hypothetical protein